MKEYLANCYTMTKCYTITHNLVFLPEQSMVLVGRLCFVPCGIPSAHNYIFTINYKHIIIWLIFSCRLVKYFRQQFTFVVLSWSSVHVCMIGVVDGILSLSLSFARSLSPSLSHTLTHAYTHSFIHTHTLKQNAFVIAELIIMATFRRK